MTFPKEVYDIVDQAVDANKGDIDGAVKSAERSIRKLECFEAIVSELVSNAIRELIHRNRHEKNVIARKASGHYGQQAKVVVGKSEKVSKAAEIGYDYFIAGMTLGFMLGSQLPAAAAAERAKKEGSARNERLLMLLIPIVPAEKRVQEAVSKRKLLAIWQQAKQSIGDHAA